MRAALGVRSAYEKGRTGRTDYRESDADRYNSGIADRQADLTAEELFLSNLPLIERVIASICRRHRCRPEEAEEFGSWVKVKLIDDDYGVLRKFRGRSRLSTYLTTVIHNFFRDYRIAQWGKWRPSAAARRLGPVAVQLDTLLTRDGHTLAEAIEILRGNFGVTDSPEELEAIAARLPARTPRRFEGEERLATLGSDDGVERRLVDAELEAAQAKTERALAEALAEMAGEDRLILKMRFEDGFTVTRIAAALRVRPRPLYSRFEKCLKRLRGALEARGVTADEIGDLLGWERSTLAVDFGRSGDRNPDAESVSSEGQA